MRNIQTSKNDEIDGLIKSYNLFKNYLDEQLNLLMNKDCPHKGRYYDIISKENIIDSLYSRYTLNNDMKYMNHIYLI